MSFNEFNKRALALLPAEKSNKKKWNEKEYVSGILLISSDMREVLIRRKDGQHITTLKTEK